MKRWLVCLVVLSATSASVFGQDKTLADEALKAELQHSLEMTLVEKSYQDRCTALRQKLIQDLQEIQMDMTKVGDLDGAILLRDKIKILKDTQAADHSDPELDSSLDGVWNLKYNDNLLRVYKIRKNEVQVSLSDGRVWVGKIITYKGEMRVLQYIPTKGSPQGVKTFLKECTSLRDDYIWNIGFGLKNRL